MNFTKDTSYEDNDTFAQYFNDFCTKDLTKIGIFLSVFLVNFMSSLLMYSIIWYEHFGSDQKRVWTNKLVSMICWNGIVGIQTHFVLDLIIFVFAPFSKSTCLFFKIIKQTIKSNFLMFLNIIAIFKYIFIFWMKNAVSLQVDFWNLFLFL